MKKTIKVTLTIIILLTAVIGFLSNYLLETAVNPPYDRRHDIEGCYKEVYTDNPEMRQWHDSLQNHGLWTDLETRDSDGLKRHAIVLEHDSMARGTTVFLHGHNDNAVRMMRYAYMHYEVLGRNVVIPDHFGHGQSRGNHIRFAWLDRLDVTNIWIPEAHKRWPWLDILVHGLSMGGAMTMYTSGEEIPDEMRVVAFIEDCGYSSIWDELAFQLKHDYNLPAFPLLDIADRICQWKYGWSFHDGETDKQLAKCSKPMLLIHGDADTYVPCEMGMRNYEAKTNGYRELWISEGSDHAMTIHDHWEEYCQRVQDFITRVYNIK